MCALVRLSSINAIVGTGWLPPMPDLRDYSAQHPKLTGISNKLGIDTTVALPALMDLRQWCSPVENQGVLGSCSAHAGMGIVEYFERRAWGNHIDGSRLFLYKTTRELMGINGDSGAFLRNVIGALAMCGVPAEKYWPYTDQSPDFDRQPSAFVYAVADNFEAVKYFCHDPGQKVPPVEVIASVKTYLAAGIPSMFGFWGFASFESVDVKGGIPYPGPDEQAQWGHAIVAVGYDDNIKVRNTRSNQETTGAFLIRNSWGTSWGDAGYGWLPYDYVQNRLAFDFWSLISMEWVDSNQFGM